MLDLSDDVLDHIVSLCGARTAIDARHVNRAFRNAALRVHAAEQKLRAFYLNMD